MNRAKKHRKPSSPVIYFLRGLNSKGDEILRLGPVGFGPYSKRILNAFKHVATVNVEGMGRGSIEEMGENAFQFLMRDPLFHSLGHQVHLFGHSMGGVVARYLAHRPEIRERVCSIVTVGTPHLGLPAAAPKDQSGAMKLIRRLVESDVKDKSGYYESLTPKNMLEFNRRYPDVSDVFYASALGVVQRYHMPFTLKVIDREYNEEPSDGLVPESSQYWGQHLGKFTLDHLEQIGLCQDVNPLHRWFFRREFRRYCNTLTDYWHSFPQNKN